MEGHVTTQLNVGSDVVGSMLWLDPGHRVQRKDGLNIYLIYRGVKGLLLHQFPLLAVLGPNPFLPLTPSPYPFKTRGRGKGKG
jgi:hypothetical protein